MNEDNQVVIKMIVNNQITEYFKHVDINYYFVRERVTNQNIKIQYCHTDKMIADGFTKSLSPTKFQTFVKMLGLRTLKDFVVYAVVNSRTMKVLRPIQVGLSVRHLPIRVTNILDVSATSSSRSDR